MTRHQIVADLPQRRIRNKPRLRSGSTRPAQPAYTALRSARQPQATRQAERDVSNARHHGRAKRMHAAWAIVLDTGYQRHPEQFVGKPPTPPQLPTAAWINKPDTKEVAH